MIEGRGRGRGREGIERELGRGRWKGRGEARGGGARKVDKGAEEGPLFLPPGPRPVNESAASLY